MNKRDEINSLKIDREDGRERDGTRRHRLLIPMVVMVAAVIAVASGWRVLHPRAVLVHTILIPPQGSINSLGGGSVLNASGYVVAKQQATVSSQVTGMIKAVYVEPGMRVKTGQVTARLADHAARLRLAMAVTQLQADQALVAKYQAQLIEDKNTLSRIEALTRKGLLSQSDLDAARAALNIDKANLTNMMDRVHMDMNNVRLQRVLLKYNVIRAPFSGVVTETYAHPGEMISPAAVGGFTKTGICMLVDMKSLEIDVDINEAYIQRVRRRERVEVMLNAYPHWTIPGHVISVVPTASKAKGTVMVRVAFDKLDPRILPQMSAQVWFFDTTSKKSLPETTHIEIPKTAIRLDSGKPYVYIVRDHHVKRRYIEVLPATGSKAAVLSGLNGGEHVVVSATTPLHDGERIRGQIKDNP